MDVEMPIMDGLEAAQAIRDAERGTDRHLPIAALTAHAMQGAREKCLRAGMDDYIAKPMRRTRLLEVIAKLAGDASAEGVVEAPVLFEAGTPRAVDWSALLDQVGGRPEALQGIVEAYVSEIRESLSQLDRFLPAGDAKRSRLHAHILVGAMRTFGATEAVALASEIERSAQDGDTARVAPALPQLRVSAERVLPELEHFLRTGRVPE
jgi:HPt (histidine-containing phosphotransfer) domain-containing protein